MGDILPFTPSAGAGSAGAGGSGPEDPMLDQRVARLEATLERIEPKISELLLVGAKQTDLHKVQLDLAELKGRVAGLESRLATVPSTTQLVLWLLTTWGAGAAIVFTVIRYSPK